MPQAQTIYTYSFDELDDSAKESARQWWRECSQHDEWWDGVYESAKDAGKMLGIDIDRIYFSGFWSQGDGACFEGSYAYAKGAAKAIRKEWPMDTTLHSIADRLQSIQRPYFYLLTANVKHSGRYSHEYCTEIDVDDYDGNCRYGPEHPASEDLQDTLRDFMRWIYKRLEAEYDYLNADEQVDENIRINEYTFYDDGSIA